VQLILIYSIIFHARNLIPLFTINFNYRWWIYWWTLRKSWPTRCKSKAACTRSIGIEAGSPYFYGCWELFAKGPVNPPAVRVWTAKTGWFSSSSVQQPDPTDCYRATPGPIPVSPWVLLGLARPVGSNLRFHVSCFTFIVAFRYATVNRKILTLVRHSSFLMNWLPYKQNA